MGKKDHRHEIQAIIELTQKLDHNDIAYFSKGQIPYLTSHSFSDYGRTVLHMAVWYNKSEILTILLAKPDILAMINIQDFIRGLSCFHRVFERAMVDKRECVLKTKFQVQGKQFYHNILRESYQKANQETPLHLAFFDQKLVCAIALIEKGAKFDIKNCIEQRPIDVLIGKKEKQVTFLQHLTQAKLPDNDDHIKMKNMIKRKISVLNKLTQSEIDDCSEILPTRSENMLNSAIGLSRRILQMQQSVQGDMECSMIEEIPIEAHPRPILEFQIRHMLKSLGFQTTKGLSSFFNSQI